MSKTAQEEEIWKISAKLHEAYRRLEAVTDERDSLLVENDRIRERHVQLNREHNELKEVHSKCVHPNTFNSTIQAMKEGRQRSFDQIKELQRSLMVAENRIHILTEKVSP